ncbi:MAG: helix-turn-helix transcriptional regulator [Deltaproteobacteria bacterium]|nr:helix-turn-helix transcriptional regulator [Deltaproteobacteria bacterium]
MARRLRELRLARGLPQGEVAKLLGISPAYLSLLEKGKRSLKLPLLLSALTLYEVSVEQFMKSLGDARVDDRLAHLLDEPDALPRAARGGRGRPGRRAAPGEHGGRALSALQEHATSARSAAHGGRPAQQRWRRLPALRLQPLRRGGGFPRAARQLLPSVGAARRGAASGRRAERAHAQRRAHAPLA